MPILEITSANAPKDTRDFVKRVSALFAECIGKPESVSLNKEREKRKNPWNLFKTV